MTVPLSRSPRRWPWLLLAPVLLLLLWLQSQLAIDVQNEAMKAPGTAEAREAIRLVEHFGGEDGLLLLFVPRAMDVPTADEADAIADLADDLREQPGVRSVTQPDPAAIDGELALLVQPTEPASAPAIEQFARHHCPPVLRLHAVGAPLAEAAIAAGVAADRQRLVPLITAALFVMLWLLHRSLAQAIAVLLPALLAILGLGAAQFVLGHRLDPVGVLLEPVLLTVGVATAVHWVAAFRRERENGHDVQSSLQRARVTMWLPTLLATATTMLGFASLVLHPISAVADFGSHAGLGTGLVHLLALTLVPRWLAAFPGPVPARKDSHAVPHARTHRYSAWLRRHASAVVIVTAALCVVAGEGWFRLRVDNDPLALLPASDPFRRDYTAVCGRIGGAETFALMVTPRSPAADPERLLPFVAAVASAPPATGLGGPPQLAADGTAMVPIRLAASGSGERTALFDYASDRAAALGLDGVTVAGRAVQIARDSDRLVRGQLKSLLLTIVGLWLGLWLGLRSMRLATIGLLPNVAPCALLYGGLGLAGQALTVGNAMIGSVMLGLIVDNTIHFLHRYRHTRGGNHHRVTMALATIARPALLASGVLALGFGTGVLGAMSTTREFALLCATTIGLAVFGFGMVLPAMLLLSRRRRTA